MWICNVSLIVRLYKLLNSLNWRWYETPWHPDDVTRWCVADVGANVAVCFKNYTPGTHIVVFCYHNETIGLLVFAMLESVAQAFFWGYFCGCVGFYGRCFNWLVLVVADEKNTLRPAYEKANEIVVWCNFLYCRTTYKQLDKDVISFIIMQSCVTELSWKAFSDIFYQVYFQDEIWSNHCCLRNLRASCARCVKLRVAHAPVMPGTFFQPPRLTILTCIKARAWRTCCDACRGR